MTTAEKLRSPTGEVVNPLSWLLRNTVLTVIVIGLAGLPKCLAGSAEDILCVCAV